MGSPRVPHSRPHPPACFSYAVVVKSSMECGNFNSNGNRGSNAWWFGCTASSYGGGQGSMFGPSGFPLANNGFHPGHNSHAPHSGGGWGRYSVRDHHGGWVVVMEARVLLTTNVRPRQLETEATEIDNWLITSMPSRTSLIVAGRLCKDRVRQG
jgi:hypothetical protein